jgi:hypothetical protein
METARASERPSVLDAHPHGTCAAQSWQAATSMQRRSSLIALVLAHNWSGGSFFEASCRLCGKTAGRCL